MDNKSTLGIAYEIMQKKKFINFYALWDEVAQKLNLSEEEKKDKIVNFYTKFSLDGRFIFIGKNRWSLRDKLPYNKIHVNTGEIYKDMDEDEEKLIVGDEDEVEEKNDDENLKINNFDQKIKNDQNV